MVDQADKLLHFANNKERVKTLSITNGAQRSAFVASSAGASLYGNLTVPEKALSLLS